jgi:hypothetical protein
VGVRKEGEIASCLSGWSFKLLDRLNPRANEQGFVRFPTSLLVWLEIQAASSRPLNAAMVGH